MSHDLRVDADVIPSRRNVKSTGEHSASLFVLPTDRLGGAEQVLRMNVLQASEHRDEVHVVFLSRGDSGAWRGMPSNVSLHYIAASSEKVGALRALPLLVRLSRRNPLAEIVSSHLHVNAYLGLLRELGLLTCKRQVVRESTVFRDRFSGVKLALFRILYRLGYDDAELVVCQTEYMKEALLDLVPRAVGWNVEVIPNPIDTEAIAQRADEPVEPSPLSFTPYLVSAGRLIPEKGYDVLLCAFERVRARHPRLRLLILGEGAEREKLEDLASDLGIADAVEMPGRVPNPVPYFACAECCVVSSRVEGFPNVLLEKMSVSDAVVSTLCAGGVDQLEGVVVCPPGEPDALAESIEAVLARPARGADTLAPTLASRAPARFWRRIAES